MWRKNDWNSHQPQYFSTILCNMKGWLLSLSILPTLALNIRDSKWGREGGRENISLYFPTSLSTSVIFFASQAQHFNSILHEQLTEFQGQSSQDLYLPWSSHGSPSLWRSCLHCLWLAVSITWIPIEFIIWLSQLSLSERYLTFRSYSFYNYYFFNPIVISGT